MNSVRSAYERTIAQDTGRVLGNAETVCKLRLARRWVLALAKPSSEEVARTNLERQGYGVYYPRLLQRMVYRGRETARIIPLFPGYLFVQLDTAKQTSAPVRSTLGIVDLVRFGSEPASVPDSIVEDLRARADAETGLHRLNACALERGAAVSVGSGVFAGLDGVFEREVGEQRVIVLLSLLGRETAVRIPSDSIRRSVAV